MVNIVKRMRKLRELLWIRVGPGALLLPKEVSKITLEFNKHINGGHRGARKFWREMLPRIKYRNPSVPISVMRHSNDSGPAKLCIYTKSASAPNPSQSSISTPPSATPNPRNTATPDTTAPAFTIDMKMIPESQILEELIEKTGATIIEPSEQELQEMKDIADFKVRSEGDRVQVREHLMKQRREEELLRLARGEITATA
ncbi:hypothetical protein CC78DRAFT_497197 [Lojkania enalia]|uniref:Ribosomal protein/NADH dehydrogenase domain-containing protein n=1 Tax=Lojkania enalia TaxID=147567 RepID=A0A9P4K6U1_9PLEO|nr:hypothetical protein CC78DRAFT_497197 [Didymosphaeria enalia]